MRALLLFALLGIAVLSAVDQDLVVLDNEQRINGTVKPAEDPLMVEVHTGGGVMFLRKERIKEIFLGLDSRLAQAKDDDLAGLVELARWCRANGRNSDALQLLSKAVMLPGCDLATKGLYATLVDEAGDQVTALKLYRAWRKDGGTDPQILARLDQLEQAVALWIQRNPGAPAPVDDLPPVVVRPASRAVLATSRPAGLEARRWESEKLAFSNPVETSMVKDQEDNQVLRMAFTGPKDGAHTDKAAIRTTVQYAIGEQNVLAFEITNRGETAIRVAIAVKTGEWQYFESSMQNLAPGETFRELRFNLKGRDFKSQATNWANTGPVAHLDDVKEIQLLIYNGSATGEVMVRRMQFIKTNEL